MDEAQLKQRIEKLEREVAYLRQLRQQHPTRPTCAGRCGRSDDLTEVIATPDGTYLLCPVCLAEEEQQS